MRHLVVRREGEIVGVLDAANVLSSLANQADPIGALIDRAETPADLAEASERIGFLVRQLHDSGTKIGFITELSTDLHRRATAGLFAKLAPKGMAEQACLVVMGSEGRGEYLTKTDQDNGIILADGYEPPGWDEFRAELHRRHDRGRLSRLPGRDHGPQSRLVEAAEGLVRRCPRLGADAGRAGADERRHLL